MPVKSNQTESYAGSEKGTTANSPNSIYIKVFDSLNKLTCFAEDSATRTENTLTPITLTAAPINLEENPPEESYPPLFASLCEYIQRIDHALKSINNTLDRTEL